MVSASHAGGLPSTPRYEAVRLAVTRYMTPVVLLSDGYIANGSEPWRIPKYEDLPAIDCRRFRVSRTAG